MADFALLSDHLPDDNSHCGDGHPPLEPQSTATVTIEAMCLLELDDDGMPPSDDLKKWVWDPVLKVPLGFLLQISFPNHVENRTMPGLVMWTALKYTRYMYTNGHVTRLEDHLSKRQSRCQFNQRISYPNLYVLISICPPQYQRLHFAGKQGDNQQEVERNKPNSSYPRDTINFVQTCLRGEVGTPL